MTEALYSIEHHDDDYSDDDELSTSFLTPAQQEAAQPRGHSLRALPGGRSDEGEPDTDWLALLSKRASDTEELPDEPPVPLPLPSGMSDHVAPPRMRPTVGARLTSGLRRGTLFVLLSALVMGVLAGGAYIVASTSWLSAVVSPEQPSPAAQLPAASEPPVPRVGQGGSPAQTGDTQSKPAPQAGGATTSGTGAQAIRDKGIEQYRAGNYSIAIDLLENAVNMDGGDALSYYQLGLAYMAATGRQHALEDAELAFRTAISLDGKWAAPHRLMAESLLRRGFYSEAITEANTSVEIDPDQADGWMTLGRAYRGAGNETEATKAFSEAMRHAPAPPR